MWGKKGKEYDVSDDRARLLCRKQFDHKLLEETGRLSTYSWPAELVKDLGKYGGRYSSPQEQSRASMNRMLLPWYLEHLCWLEHDWIHFIITRETIEPWLVEHGG